MYDLAYPDGKSSSISTDQEVTRWSVKAMSKNNRKEVGVA